MSNLIVPGHNQPEPEGGVVFDCQRCGLPLPPMDKDLAAMARSAGGVTLAHDVCPGEERQAPTGRYFEVRVDIVEVSTVTDVASGEEFDPEVTELVSFKAGVTAKNLDAAMRPLALALGEKWAKAEKQAGVADSLNHPQPRSD